MKKRIMTMALLVAVLCFGSCYAKDAASAFLPPQNLRVPAVSRRPDPAPSPRVSTGSPRKEEFRP